MLKKHDNITKEVTCEVHTSGIYLRYNYSTIDPFIVTYTEALTKVRVLNIPTDYEEFSDQEKDILDKCNLKFSVKNSFLDMLDSKDGPSKEIAEDVLIQKIKNQLKEIQELCQKSTLAS